MVNRNDVLSYVKKKYGTEPDFPWFKYPQYAVLRHRTGKKWYGLLMTIPKAKLKIAGDGNVDIINLKCDAPLASLFKENGIFPAYHMNKKHWISVVLDEKSPKDNIYSLIDLSFDLTK